MLGIALVANGKIVIGGSFNGYQNGGGHTGVMRLNADGTGDSTFNTSGSGVGPREGVSAIAADADGRLLISGGFTKYNGDSTIPRGIIRLNADGTRDLTFNPGGAGAGTGAQGIGPIVLLQPGGKIVVGGDYTTYNGNASVPRGIMRLLPGSSNAPPTLTPAGSFTRQQASASANSQIATTSDPEGGGGSVAVTVTSANPSNGVTLSNIVNTNGTVTADVVANCGATNASFSLAATDGNGATTTATLNVTVTANAAPTLTYSSPQSVAFNGSLNVTPTAASDNGAITGYAVQSVSPALATVPTVNASGVVSITNAQPAGAHTIMIRATDNCGATTDASFTLNVSKGNQTITVNTHAPANAGFKTSFTVAATSSSGLAVAYSSAGVCTNIGAVFTMTSATGTCTVKYDQTGDSNFNPATQVTESVTAQKANQTITVGTHAPASATYNTSFTVAATSSSGLAVAYSSVGVCTNVGAVFTMTSGAGTCTVVYDQAGDSNYNPATQVTELVTAQKANQTITVNTHAPVNAAFNTSFTVAATSSSGLAVAYSSAGVCTNVGAVFTITSGSGTCTVKYDQIGNANFNAATQVTESVTAQKANQTITVGTHAPASPTYNTSFTVAATSTSGLAVSYSSAGVCTNVGAVFTMASGTGTCTVKYDRAGDSNYNPATQVTETVSAQKANQTITFGSLSNRPFGSPDFSVSATATSDLAVSFTASGQCTVAGSTVHLTGVGSCTITASQAGDGNFNAATSVPQTFTITGALIALSQSSYAVSESTGLITITVNRTGDTSVPVSLDYATDDTGSSNVCSTLNSGMASSRCDFGLARGTLKFAATETQKTFVITITQDSFTEGPEMFTVNLSNLTGVASFATPSSATVTINDSAGPAPNTNDDPDAFVRQQYRDFLHREADPSGLAFWTNQITSCGNDAACRDIRRTNVSAAFFLSIEFQDTGNFVRSFYVAALDRPLTNNMPGFVEFERDTQAVQRGVVAGQGNWQQTLSDNRDAFMKDFVTRPEFVGLYPTTDTPTQYVDKLYVHAAVTPATVAERQAAIDEFTGAGTAADAGARGRALLRITQNAAFVARETNRSFVQMEYLGYLRRNPNDPPDGNFAGYNFWLNKLNQFNGNYVAAEMVKSFIVSDEYRARFGP